jgi:hypothetical protein
VRLSQATLFADAGNHSALRWRNDHHAKNQRKLHVAIGESDQAIAGESSARLLAQIVRHFEPVVERRHLNLSSQQPKPSSCLGYRRPEIVVRLTLCIGFEQMTKASKMARFLRLPNLPVARLAVGAPGSIFKP